MQETSEIWVQSLSQEDSLTQEQRIATHSQFQEQRIATHSSILAWRIPWTEEPGSPQFIEPHRVGHSWSDLALMQSLYICITFYNKVFLQTSHIISFIY